MRSEVELILGRGEKSEEVFFELETNELLGTHVTHGPWAGGIELVPSVVDDC